jgi:hypothetical protein
MASEVSVRAVSKRARALFRNGIAQSDDVQRLGKIREPIPILEPDGTINSWFVPVQVRDKLAGFMQLTPDLVLKRYASFWRGEQDFANCPDARSWIDRSWIQERARTIAKPSEHLNEPALAYHKHPTRIAWRIIATDQGDKTSVIYVTGDSAFRDDDGDQQMTLGR